MASHSPTFDLSELNLLLTSLQDKVTNLSQEDAQRQELETLPSVIEGLRVTLEELRVADEELHQQSESLMEAGEQLTAERIRYQELFEFAPDGYLVTDPDGTIQEANRAAVALLNVPKPYLLGKPLTVFVSEDARPAFRRDLRLLRAGETAAEWETRLRPRHRTPFEAALTVSATRDPAGYPFSLRWSVRDVTFRRQSEERIKTMGTQMQTLNVRLQTIYNDLERDFQERTAQLESALARERRIAETLQRTLQPDVPAAFSGLAVAPFYEAALEEARIGGDFYDAFALHDGRVALIVGDVSGKGLTAAARTAEVKYALRAFLQEYADPAHALTRLNEFVCDALKRDDWADDTFVILSLLVIELSSGTLLYAAAGADPLLIFRRGDDVDEIMPERVAGTGLPLGVLRGAEYEAAQTRLETSDMLLMATDGITEARQGQNFLEFDGLVKLTHASLPQEDLTQIGAAILSGARAFAGGKLHDDACLLLARREKSGEHDN